MAVSTVLEKLGPQIESEVKLILSSKQEAETLRTALESVQVLLQDAERRGVTEEIIKHWLKRLEDVMYDMDDALDKLEMKKMEKKIERLEYDEISNPLEKVRYFLFMRVCLSFKHVVGRRGLTLEMKSLNARLEKILKEKDTYNLVPDNSVNSRELKKLHQTTAAVVEPKVCGREFDKRRLLESLLPTGEQHGKRVIPIVGQGGLGKTTLAQLIYKDDTVKDHFKLRAWVSVPGTFHALQVAEAILGSFRQSSSGNLQTLGEKIESLVSEQNFLLVLDNVLTVDDNEWEPLMNFLVRKPGCRILVTTKDQTAAATMAPHRHWHILKELSHQDCETIIMNTIALEGRTEEEQGEFHRVGYDIAEKCKGLPLAAKAIGRVLSSRSDIQQWRDVLESPLWKYEHEMGNVLGPLRLSYMDLSPIQKRCFLSCMLYPKGTEFTAAELIRFWMAQGYISSSATRDGVHKNGRKLFGELFKRSFFQGVGRDKSVEGGSICKVHDVMHEFASSLSESEHYHILYCSTHSRDTPVAPGTRYFSARYVSRDHLPENFLGKLKRVRVLCLRNCKLEELSEEVGELIHLRYLDLSWNPLKQLPETLCDLYSLQTLDLRHCDMSMLPRGIGKLINLKHLLIRFTPSLKELPRGLYKLTDLWELDYIIATRDSVEFLGKLGQLRGYLQIDVQGLNEAAEGERANLRSKNHIEELKLSFSADVSMDVVDAMVPPPRLKSLCMGGEDNHQLPSWILTSLSNLKKLRIKGFDCSCLPALRKLPNLETLRISKMKFKSVTLEFLGISGGTSGTAVGGFPKLKKLQFYNCELWEEWEDLPDEEEAEAAAAAECSVPVRIMPCLKVLEIVGCPKLQALPHNLLRRAAPLQKLIVYSSDRLQLRYSKYSGADRGKISHIPRIDIALHRSEILKNINWAIASLARHYRS